MTAARRTLTAKHRRTLARAATLARKASAMLHAMHAERDAAPYSRYWTITVDGMDLARATDSISNAARLLDRVIERGSVDR